MTAQGEALAAHGSILLAGAGKMGGALLQGWLSIGIEGRLIGVLDPQATPALKTLCRERGVALNPSDPAPPDILVLAIKPQMLDAAAPALAPLVGPDTLLLSVIAGKTLADLAARLPGARAMVRAMPNTPASVGRGITGVHPGADLEGRDRDRVDRLLGAVGRVEWLASEDEVDAVTAVSGSGPAYVFLFAECLGVAGERLGLPPGLARRLARATVEGAGELMFREAALAPEVLRQNVTSPGGTTAAALDVLLRPQGLQSLLDEAVVAAKRRAGELAG